MDFVLYQFWNEILQKSHSFPLKFQLPWGPHFYFIWNMNTSVQYDSLYKKLDQFKFPASYLTYCKTYKHNWAFIQTPPSPFIRINIAPDNFRVFICQMAFDKTPFQPAASIRPVQ